MSKEKEYVDTSNLHQCGKLQIVVSERELKYNDGDEVITYKVVNGKKEPTSTMLFSDIDTMKSYLSQKQIEVLACANHLVRCQNIARQWNKIKVGKIDSGIVTALKGKDLTDEQKAKVIAYLNKL